jgi:hypothetical protein
MAAAVLLYTVAPEKIILKDKITESGGCRFHQAYIPGACTD